MLATVGGGITTIGFAVGVGVGGTRVAVGRGGAVGGTGAAVGATGVSGTTVAATDSPRAPANAVAVPESPATDRESRVASEVAESSRVDGSDPQPRTSKETKSARPKMRPLITSLQSLRVYTADDLHRAAAGLRCRDVRPTDVKRRGVRPVRGNHLWV